MKKGYFCPLIKKDCIENKCAWYVQVMGTNPNTGEPLDQWHCSLTLLPILLIENGRQQKSTAAAVESFRNESMNKNDTTNALLLNLQRTTGVQVARISEVRQDLINPGS